MTKSKDGVMVIKTSKSNQKSSLELTAGNCGPKVSRYEHNRHKGDKLSYLKKKGKERRAHEGCLGFWRRRRT